MSGQLNKNREFTMTTSATTAAQNTIVAFHIGRGGHFYNPGHVTFLGEKKISDYTGDLFETYENYYDLCKDFKGKENLTELLQSADEGNEAAKQRLSRWAFELGQAIYTDGGGNPVGLTVEEAESGIGRINIDNDYDTTYAQLLSDCSDGELELIRKSYDFNSLSSDCQEYIKEMLGEEETETND